MAMQHKPKLFRPALLNTTADPMTYTVGVAPASTPETDGGAGFAPDPAESAAELEPDMDEEKDEPEPEAEGKAGHKSRKGKSRK
jgi:hypothetical protein